MTVWAGILVIDPNGLRETNPGPLYFLLDTIDIHPGLTNKSGSFSGTINDNKNDDRLYDMMLFDEDSPYIQDNDEFWVGIQQGSTILPDDEFGLVNDWTPANGGRAWIMGGFTTKRSYKYDAETRITAVIESGEDYMGLWRKIPIGSLNLPLKTVMPKGATSSSYFNYTRPTEIYKLFESILAYVNRSQDKDYRFSPSDDYFPAQYANQGAPVDGTITQYRRQYSGEPSNIDAFSLMEKLCEAGGLEWQIVPDPENQQWGYASPTAYWTNPPLVANLNQDGTGRTATYGGLFSGDWRFLGKASSRRMLMVYPRKDDYCPTVYGYGATNFLPPRVGLTTPNWTYRGTTVTGFTAALTLDFTVIRDIPKIVVDDSTNLATNLILTGDAPTYPTDRDAWMNSILWVDLDDVSWKSVSTSVPLPSNSSAYWSTSRFADASLVWDDEGHPAICFRKWNRNRIMPMLGFHPSLRHEDWVLRAAQFEVDLREMRHLRFKVRDPDYYDVYQYPLNLPRGNTYRVKLHCDIGDQAYTAWADNYLYQDLTLTSADWTDVNLVLPEIRESKTSPGFTVFNYNGWSIYGTVDVTKIDWVSFDVNYTGTEPGPVAYLEGGVDLHFLDRLTVSGATAGAKSIQLNYPERYFQLGPGFGAYSGVIYFTEPQPMLMIGDITYASHEIVYISAIEAGGTSGRWEGKNILLTQPLKNTYPSPYLFLPGGWSFCVSQLRFEDNNLTENLTLGLTTDQQNPKRYRVVNYADMKYNGEINERIRQEALRSKPLAMLNVIIDGDLRYHIGFQVTVDLGVGSPFHLVDMMIDDIQYIVDGVDFYMILTLGSSDFDKRSYLYDLQQLQGNVIRKLIRDEVGSSPPRGTEVRRNVL